MSAPRTLLVDTDGRLMRMAQGDLATPDCPECCGGGRRCARAFLCPTTFDYANVTPKSIVFTCPESGFLCTSPPGPWLVAYKGYCYQPLYNEDGSLVCSPNCGSGGDVEDIGDPVGKLTCLPSTTCDDSPCKDPYPTPTCCVTKDLWCPRECGCDPLTICDCGKRWVVVWFGSQTYEYWATDCGKCFTVTVQGGGAAIVTHYGGACQFTDVRHFGGLWRTVTRQDESGYCPADPPAGTEWIPWTGQGGYINCGFAPLTRPPQFTVPEHGNTCDHTQYRACTLTQSGIDVRQTGQVDCTGATFEWRDIRLEESTCCLRERTLGAMGTLVQRLVECDDARPGEPPSIGELGLF